MSTLATFPITTIKVNQQGKKKKRSILATIFMLYISFGIKGFYKGLSSKLLYTILSMALMNLIYERLKKKIKRKVYLWHIRQNLRIKKKPTAPSKPTIMPNPKAMDRVEPKKELKQRAPTKPNTKPEPKKELNKKAPAKPEAKQEPKKELNKKAPAQPKAKLEPPN